MKKLFILSALLLCLSASSQTKDTLNLDCYISLSTTFNKFIRNRVITVLSEDPDEYICWISAIETDKGTLINIYMPWKRRI